MAACLLHASDKRYADYLENRRRGKTMEELLTDVMLEKAKQTIA